MKLKKFTKDGYVKYWDTQEEIDIPEYIFRQDDVRGVWISNVGNIDTKATTNIEEYKTQICEILDNVKSYNMNTIVFQVRPLSDAYYPSKLNPWSRYITGEEGRDPGFDVLQYVIEEAAVRGIKVHAWMNPYRVSVKPVDTENKTVQEAILEYVNTLDDLNFAKRHPEHVIADGSNKLILAPSHPEVIEFVTASIMEVATRYDVEAVHIDDYFYPYAKIPEEYEHDDYLKYRESPDQSFDDFRRMNVNKMIESVHNELKKLLSNENKKVDFGISPFAVYRTHSSIIETGWDKGSFHSEEALECYHRLYSDVYKWMKEGWIDYVVPQIYWPFEREDITYHDMVKWWHYIAKETNTKLYIGQGLYKMGKLEVWMNKEEMVNQLKFNSQYDQVTGVVMFTYKDLLKGQNEVKDQALDLIKKLWNN